MTSQYNLIAAVADTMSGVTIVEHHEQVRTEGPELGTVQTKHGVGARDTYDMDLLRKAMRQKMYKFKAYKHYLLPKKMPVYQTCSEFIISKQETRNYGDIVDIDSKCIRPTVEYVMELRKLAENEDLLIQTKKKVENMRSELDAQWQQLADDENELKLNFIRFNKFVKENLDKRERAAKKLVYEQEVRERKERDVEVLKVNLERVKMLKVKMEKTTRSYRIFEEYLSAVVNSASSQGAFKTIDDILNKYESIMSAKRKLADMQNQRLVELEENRQKLAKIVTYYKLLILGLTTRRCDLSQRYKKISAITRAREVVVEKIKNSTMTIISQAVLARLAIENMYFGMCDRRTITPTIADDDYEHQLNFIKLICRQSVKVEKEIRKRKRAERTTVCS